MGTIELVPHPGHPPHQVSRVAARIVALDADWLRLRWRVEGAGALVVPPFAGRGRADGLWRTTCFELFVKPAGGNGYAEFNLSPSERWAAYRFAAYRRGQADLDLPREPACTLRRGSRFAIFDAAIPAIALFAGEPAAALTAVIEEEGGTISYWAAAHGPGPADFHAAACVTGALPAPRLA